MDFDYDVVIVGGAFSGAASAQLIKRKQSNAGVLIIEKNAEFDRKVGESTSEVSSCFMTRILGLANYVGRDVASYYFSLVIRAYRNPEQAFLELPFQGRAGQMAARVMRFYNRRLVALAKRRLATGRFARHNSGWRELYDGFVPDFRVTKLLRKGLFRWWKAELTNFRLMFAPPIAELSKETSAVSTAQA